MLKTILVPLDDSEDARRVLSYVTALATGGTTQVVLVYAMSDPVLRDHAASVLERACEDLGQRGVSVSGIVYTGAPATSIIEAAQTHHASLIALATEHLADLDRWLNGSLADEVLRHAGIPVLVVPPGCARQWPTAGLKLLVPLDGSELAEAALEPALAIAHRVHGDLTLLRVTGAHEASDNALEYLDGVAAELESRGTRPREVVVSGAAAHDIADVARLERIDLIVMATHGRTGLARLTFGSVATRTLQSAGVPIVLVRPARVSPALEAEHGYETVPMTATPPWFGG